MITPLLDNQKLAGITRQIVLGTLRSDGNIEVEERVVTMDEVRNADEVWITSSSKEIAPVTEIDGVASWRWPSGRYVAARSGPV